MTGQTFKRWINAWYVDEEGRDLRAFSNAQNMNFSIKDFSSKWDQIRTQFIGLIKQRSLFLKTVIDFRNINFWRKLRPFK